MKIAILSTPWIALPPVGYGGTELVVTNLSEGLVKKGHDVTVFATGDSQTNAKLAYYYKKALGVNADTLKNPYHTLLHFHEFLRLINEQKFDIIHNNMGLFGLFMLDGISTPFVHTLHGAYAAIPNVPSLTIESQRESLMHFKHHPYISISNNQRTLLPELNYVKTVYNGIQAEEFSLGSGTGKYLVWIGRLSPVKGLPVAINAAKKAGMKLKIAAHVSKEHMKYYETAIKPLLDESIEFIGELTTVKEKNDFLKEATALLFPIQWDEPFGLVMVESLASGTPVIAFNRGSVPEIVEDGKTGFIVDTEDEISQAISKVASIDRNYCHTYAVTHFNTEKMTEGYLEAFNEAVANFTLKNHT